jgi:two-component system, sensor histidine kinase YesM
MGCIEEDELKKLTHSFRFRLLIIYFVSTLFPLLCISVVTPIYFKSIYMSNLNKALSNTLYSMSLNIDFYLSDLDNITIMPYTHSQVMDYLKYLRKPNTLLSSAEKYTLEQNYCATIQKLINIPRSDVTAVLFVPIGDDANRAKTYIVTRNSADMATFYDEDIAHQPWLAETVKKQGGSNFLNMKELNYSPTSLKKNLNVFSVSRLIFNINNNSPLGVIRVDAADTEIEKILKHIAVSPNSNLILTDPHNRVIYSLNPVNSKIMSQIGRGFGTVRYADDTFSIQHKYIASAGWTLYFLVSRKDIAPMIAPIYFSGVLAALFFILVATLLYTSSSSSLVRSIQEILGTMQSIERGDMTKRAEVVGKDELSIIADGLNRMIENLRIHINNEYIAVIKSKESEYNALRSQINPHFLYNILAGVLTLSRLGEKKALTQIVHQLTDLLRYSFDHSKLSTIVEESEFARRYLELQKFRFEDRLNFSIQIAPRTKEILIPKFLLQPLVENSIMHGMEPGDKVVMIEIMTSVCRMEWENCEAVHIQVIDNGLGFDTGLIKLDERKSVALSNIRSRLLMHDNRSLFDIKSSPGNGTSISIIMPMRPMADASNIEAGNAQSAMVQESVMYGIGTKKGEPE